MKIHHLLALTLVPSLLIAQSDGDPFAKKNAPPPAASPPAALKAGAGSDLLNITLERYTLPTADTAALLTEGLTDTALHQRLRDLVRQPASNAKLDWVGSTTTRSGQRTRSESIDEIIHPTQYSAGESPTALPQPTTWEMHPCGDYCEIDPILLQDGLGVHVNIALNSSSLTGFHEMPASGEAATQISPIFEKQDLTQSFTSKQGRYRLLTVQPNSADPLSTSSLVFCQPTVVHPKPAARPASDAWQVILSSYTLDRQTASDLLTRHAPDPSALHDAVIEAGQLEHLQLVITPSGQRASNSVGESIIYGSEVETATPQTSGCFTLFENRPTAWRFELDPVLNADRTVVDINLSIEHTEHRGDLAGHPLLTRLPAAPLFSLRIQQTSLTVGVGQIGFIGTLNHPRATGVNGREDDGKTVLAFIEVRNPAE